MARIFSIGFLALLPILTGCAVTVNPGHLWVGVQPTWAENKQIDSVSGSTSISSSRGGPTIINSNQAVRMSYDLGEKKCVSNESASNQTYDAKGRKNDRWTSYQNYGFTCRPMTTAEKAERLQKLKAVEALIAAEAAKAAASATEKAGK